MKFVFDKLQNYVGKGENAGYLYCLPFLQSFKKLSSPEDLKFSSRDKGFTL